MKDTSELTQQTSRFKEREEDVTEIKDYDLRSLNTNCINETELNHAWWDNFKYLLAGMVFGIVLVKAQVMSWFRIQEMFRLQSFHMYGVIGTAVITGMISVWIIRKFKLKTIHGEAIHFHPKKFNKGQVIGGLIFGFGWAMTGACPGPMFAQLGAGFTVVIVVIISAVAGTWVYGKFRDKLPH